MTKYQMGDFLINRIPSVFAPQCEDTVQPARVTNTSLNGAKDFASSVISFTSSGSQPAWVITRGLK